MLNIRDLVTLNGIDYIVISSVLYESVKYYYLADINKEGSFKYCYINNNDLTEIEDSNLIMKLIPLFADQAFMELNNYMKNN